VAHPEQFPLAAATEHPTTSELVVRYAQRMLIENALSDAVRFFHMDALSSTFEVGVGGTDGPRNIFEWRCRNRTALNAFLAGAWTLARYSRPRNGHRGISPRSGTRI
jgi:hypothetical protein